MTDRLLPLMVDVRRASQSRDAIATRQANRLREVVRHARSHSPFYRELYANAPVDIERLSQVPTTDKRTLMARFDDWVTDKDITLARAREFSTNPDVIGDKFLGKYTIVTTSGTTGTPGIFIIDDGAMRVTSALMLRMLRTWLGVGDLAKIVAKGGRLAMVADIGHHSATSVAAARILKSHARRKRVQLLSVKTPVPELVAQLNAFQPALLAPYASMARLLASEQESGRLSIDPVLTVLAAEGLPLPEYARIASAFGTKVGNSYAATECPFLSYSCEYQWLHVNADWVLIEPVDAEYKPVPAGSPSHTVLLTNLANRVQPIVRYDLGDSVIERPDTCPCGSPLLAIRVQGRSADVLRFESTAGRTVTIAPLAFELDHIAGVTLSQIVQTSRAGLAVRLQADEAHHESAWLAARQELRQMLDEHGLPDVHIERDQQGPLQTARGKYRSVIPLSQ